MKKLMFTILSIISAACLWAQSDGVLHCDKATYDNLKELSSSKLANGSILLFTTTHQDIGWLDHPFRMKKERDSMWLRPMVDRLLVDKDYKAEVEQSSIIMEFLDRNPEEYENLERFISEGRLTVGASYTQPYEEMYSGESIIRQFYLGKMWLEDTFNGYSPTIYYNPDVPGRTLQMPQILSSAGVEAMLITRHEKSIGDWFSPNGDNTTFYSSGHYMHFYQLLGEKSFGDFASKVAVEGVFWSSAGLNAEAKKGEGVMPAMLNYEFIWDQSPIANITPYTSAWNEVTSIACEGEKTIKVSLPKFKYATAEEFIAQFKTNTPVRKQIAGERPNVWLYIHGPSHEPALTASRRADILITSAEKFAVADALTDGSMASYPDREIDEVWYDKVYPDHGWGGKNGDFTDAVFLSRFLRAENNSEAILDGSLGSLASKVKTSASKGKPVIIFNSLSWDRNSPVEVKASFAKGEMKDVVAVSANGSKCATQLSDVERYDDGSIRRANVEFIASTPSIGYSTYYLTSRAAKSVEHNGSTIENSFYKIELTEGGIKQIYDKELGEPLLDTSNLLGGEVYTVESVGNGAGEFDSVQPVSMNGFDKVSNYSPVWEKIEDGELYTTFKLRSPILHAVIEQEVKIYHTVKKIDFDIDIKNWDHVLYREFRMAIPLRSKAEVSYEVPFGILTVGKDEWQGAAGERYLTPNEDIHPRGIENWIGASTDKVGITLSSSVVAADYIDPTSDTENTVLQPILMASRKSCHGEGNDYRLFGDHSFNFSLTSHKTGREQGAAFGRESNEVPYAIFNPQPFGSASLSESGSFFAPEDKNFIITSVKRAEDGDDVIVRGYNISSSDISAKINSSLIDTSKAERNTVIEKPESVNNPSVVEGYTIATQRFKK